MTSYSRPDVATWAQISMPQLEYLGKASVAAPDVGDQRKRFSLHEGRLVVIAGAAMGYGLTPRSLVRPIGWLRDFTKWPSIPLPDTLNEIGLEVVAEELRSLVDDLPIDDLVKRLAPRVFASWLGTEAMTLSYESAESFYSGARQSSAKDDVERSLRAETIARDMLAQPQKWTIDELRSVRHALDFELACTGKKELYFHVSTGDTFDDTGPWKTYLSSSVERIEDQSIWLVIDLRHLFKNRKLDI